MVENVQFAAWFNDSALNAVVYFQCDLIIIYSSFLPAYIGLPLEVLI